MYAHKIYRSVTIIHEYNYHDSGHYSSSRDGD
jgi:hypothetical protein